MLSAGLELIRAQWPGSASGEMQIYTCSKMRVESTRLAARGAGSAAQYSDSGLVDFQ